MKTKQAMEKILSLLATDPRLTLEQISERGIPLRDAHEGLMALYRAGHVWIAESDPETGAGLWVRKEVVR